MEKYSYVFFLLILRASQDTINTSEEEELENMDAEEAAAEELDQSIARSEVSSKTEAGSGDDGKSESKKSTPVKIKTESLAEVIIIEVEIRFILKIFHFFLGILFAERICEKRR